MRVIIVEDEITAIRKLEDLLQKVIPGVNVLVHLYNVKDAVDWINCHDSPDVGFFDIQLSDDHSFQIFERTKVNFPVVFVTAFDDYLLKAFELNSIHYILKPITEGKLKQAIEKLRQLRQHFTHQNLMDILNNSSNSNIHQKILARQGMDFVPVRLDEVSYFFTEYKLTFLVKRSGELYTVDHSLSELEELLDRSKFFRANRQYIIHINAVHKFRPDEQSRIEIETQPKTKEKVRIAKERSKDFKLWITGE